MSNSFKTLGFAPQLEKLIEANGFTSPTPIQMKAIPLVRQGYDLLAAAQTGTGKTAAFVLPMLQKMIEEPTLYQKRVPRVLVLTPTRELAAQVGETILSLGKDLGVRSAVVFGGVGINGHVAFNEAQDELTPEGDDKDVTVRPADRKRDVKSLISYLIGVVMGRYSLDIPGLAYAGGEWDASKYQTYHPDEDGIIPIYRGIGMEDGLTAQIIGLLKFIYSEDTYRQNIDFIAESIGHNNNESSEEALNRYLNDGFFADHLKIYQKRPIYWFFSSGKNSGFKCLVYMHRNTRDTLARINSRYFLPESTRLKNELEELAGRLAKAEGRDRVRLEKERQKLAASYNEAIEYGQVLDHMANQYIEIDLDDGVKVNYAKFQGVEMVTDSGNKVRKDLLAPIK